MGTEAEPCYVRTCKVRYCRVGYHAGVDGAEDGGIGLAGADQKSTRRQRHGRITMALS